MMDVVYQLHFTYPYAFWLIAFYIISLFLFKEQTQTIYFSNMKMVEKASKNQKYLMGFLKFLIFTSMVIALANPFKQNEITTSKGKGDEISLILDASGSMLENNKFEITKNILNDFIAKRPHDRLSLSIFADYAYVAIPLTYDKKTLSTLLKYVEVGAAGQLETALYEALYLSSNLFKESTAKNKIAILITDGINSATSVPLETALKRVKKFGIKVYTIGIGTDGDYNSAVLKKIAHTTGGKFYQANGKKEIEDICNEIDRLEKSEIKTQKSIQKIYYFQYPLYFALTFLLLYFILNRKTK